MSKAKIGLVSVAILVLASACSSGDEKAANTGQHVRVSGNFDHRNDISNRTVSGSGASSGLSGKWTAGCRTNGFGDEYYSYETAYNFGKDSKMSLISSSYTGKTCDQVNSKITAIYRSVISYSNSSSTITLVGANSMSYVTYFDQPTVDGRNSEGKCGKDWVIGVEHVDCEESDRSDSNYTANYTIVGNELKISFCDADGRCEEEDLNRAK